MVNILYSPILAKDTPDLIISSNYKAHASNILLLLGLISDSTKSAGVPNINLSGERILKMNLSKYRYKDGKLKICKLSDLVLQKVISVLEILTSALLKKGDTKPIILDNVCSRISTGFRYDFVDGTLVQICHPHLMDGILPPCKQPIR